MTPKTTSAPGREPGSRSRHGDSPEPARLTSESVTGAPERVATEPRRPSSELGVSRCEEAPRGNLTTASLRRWIAKPTERHFVPVAELRRELTGDAARHVVVCGPGSEAAVRSVALDPPPGWRPHGTSHGAEAHPSAVLHRVGSRDRVRVTSGDQWTGGDTSAATTAAAWAWLDERVGELFPGGRLLASPATTGRDLLARSLPAGTAYSVQSAELQELLRDPFGGGGQHRIEQLAEPGVEVAQLVDVDMRLAYAACLRGAPWGLPERWRGAPEPWDPYVPARYLVSWRAPDGWDHVGLLGELTADGWQWPERGRGWVDHRELALALRYGWDVTVRESIVWRRATDGKSDPMRCWGERLARVLGECPGDVERAMTRALLIMGVGALQGRPRPVVHSIPIVDGEARTPKGATRVRLVTTATGDRVTYTTHEPPAWPELSHPEWAASIWAACRVRLLTAPGVNRRAKVGALHVERGELLGFRGDAMYLRSDPGWADDGKVGRWRVKGSLGPLTMPTSLPALDRLRGRGRRDG